MVNKTKITGKNVFNGDQFGTKGNHESSYVEKNFFLGIFTDMWAVLWSLDRKIRICNFL